MSEMKYVEWCEDFEPYLNRFTEKQKEDLYSLYNAILNFFGDKVELYVCTIPEFPDAGSWFIQRIIIPERNRILKQKIIELSNNRDNLLPEVITGISDKTLSSIMSFYTKNKENNEECKSEAFNFTVNSSFTSAVFEMEIDDPEYRISRGGYDYFINMLLDDEEKLLEYLSKYNYIVHSEDEETTLDFYLSKSPRDKRLKRFIKWCYRIEMFLDRFREMKERWTNDR